MKFNVKRQLQVGLLTLAVVGGLATQSQAGIIPWLYDAVFGPPGSVMYGTGYRGYGMTYGAGYSPYGYGANYGYGAAAYAPATGCNSCATSSATYYGPVNSSDCSVPSRSQTTQRPTPVEQGPAPDPTFDPMDNEGVIDDGFRGRGTGEDGSATSTGAFKPPVDEGIPDRPAPAAEAEEEKSAEPDTNSIRVPSLNLDSAATTHPLVAHRRTQWHARFVTPSIARTTPKIDTKWVPAATETRIAGK